MVKAAGEKKTSAKKPKETPLEKAARELEKLKAQVDEAQQVLTSLKKDVAKAEIHLDSSRAAQLLEANEQLVFSMLCAQTDPETAEAAREKLAREHQIPLEISPDMDDDQASQLLDANEQLVLSMLQAHSDAEVAARELKELAHTAETDLLTQLPNRMLLLDRFSHAIANAKRRRDRLALLFVDLNKFKQINDTLGHDAGDEALKHVAQCLTDAVRESDTVSRHGGDEFLVLLAEVSQIADVVLIANKILTALAVPWMVGSKEVQVGASIGISVYPDDGDNADTLIHRADTAMYRAKRQGLGGFVFYGDEPENADQKKSKKINPLQTPSPHYKLALFKYERRHSTRKETKE